MNEQEQKQRVDIQRVYTKDISLETPNTPLLFRQEWKPETQVDLHVSHQSLENNHYEVVLRITVTMKNKGDTAMLAEVKQAAIFEVEGLDQKQLDHVLGAYCPTVLFPYAREAISSLSTRATLPPINLAPINFDAVYAQQQQQQTQATDENEQETTVKH